MKYRYIIYSVLILILIPFAFATTGRQYHPANEIFGSPNYNNTFGKDSIGNFIFPQSLTVHTAFFMDKGYDLGGLTLESDGDIKTKGNVIIDQNITAKGYASIGGGFGDTGVTISNNGDIQADGNGSINGNLLVEHNLTVNDGNLEVNGIGNITGNLSVGEHAGINHDISNRFALEIGQYYYATTISGGLRILGTTGSSTFDTYSYGIYATGSDLSGSGAHESIGVYATGGNTTGSAGSLSAAIRADEYAGDTSATKYAIFSLGDNEFSSGSVCIGNGACTVPSGEGNLLVENDITVGNDLSAGNDVDVTGNVKAGGGYSVGGSTLYSNGNIKTKGNVTFDDDLKVAHGMCLGEWCTPPQISGNTGQLNITGNLFIYGCLGPVIKGRTTLIYAGGTEGNLTGMNAICQYNFGAYSHLCTAQEVLGTINCGAMNEAEIPGGWYSTGTSAAGSDEPDCRTWSSSSVDGSAHYWDNTTKSGKVSACNVGHPLLCCGN